MKLKLVGNRAEKDHEKSLWNEYVNEETGESTYQEHKPKVIAQYCGEDNHYWEQRGREVRCKNCGMMSKFIVGAQEVKNGKIINKI